MPYFHLLALPLKWLNEDFYIFHLPLFTTTSPLLTQPSFSQSYFFWKNKVKHTGVDITCFFQDAKSSLPKHKKCFLVASYGTSQTSKLQPFTKKVNGLQPKTIFVKKLQLWMSERVLKNINSYFVESFPK